VRVEREREREWWQSWSVMYPPSGRSLNRRSLMPPLRENKPGIIKAIVNAARITAVLTPGRAAAGVVRLSQSFETAEVRMMY
jgi:hypothetical protein